MSRTQLATLGGLALAALVAMRLERTVAVGVLSGYLFGAGISLLAVAWQTHLVRRRPSQVMQATVGGFLAQLVALMVGFLALRFVEPVAALADWRSFLLAFASASFVCLVFGSFDTARILKAGALQPEALAMSGTGVQKGQVN